jgi:hypothetical protein
MLLQDVPKIRTSLPVIYCRSLELIEFGNATGYAQIRRTLLSVTTGVCESEVVLFVGTIVGPRDDMVYVQLTVVEH